MTRKDFALIAAALRSALANGCYRDERAYEVACDEMQRALAAANPAFDRARFLSACGVFTTY